MFLDQSRVDVVRAILKEAGLDEGVVYRLRETYEPRLRSCRTGGRDRAGPEHEIRRQTSLGHVEKVTRDLMGQRRITELDGREVQHTPDLLGRDVRRGLALGGLIESAYDPMGRLAQRRSVTPVAQIGVGAGQPGWIGAEPQGVTAHKAGAPARIYGKGNRLERQGNTTFRWDADRRLVEKATYADGAKPGDAPEELWTYAWNAAGLMQSAERGDGLVVEFTHDAFARRLEKRVSKKIGAAGIGREEVRKVRFVWDGDVLVHEIREEARAAGDPIVEERTYWFEDGGFEPLAHRERRRDDVGRESGGWFHYLNDPIGARARVIHEDGRLVASAQSAALGSPAPALHTPFPAPGEYRDEETELHYNRYRFYDPDAGRFISPDPLGLRAGLNIFRGIPSRFSWCDPLGLEWNYRLRADGPDGPGTGPVYYHGKAGDNVSPAKVMQRHRNSGRLGLADRLEQISERETPKDTVRGVEQAGSVITRECATNSRGNKIKAAGPRNKSTSDRIGAGQSFIDANSESGTVLGLPTLVTHGPSDPRATNKRWKAAKDK